MPHDITIVTLAKEFQTTSAKIKTAMRRLGILDKENRPSMGWIDRVTVQPGPKPNNWRWPKVEVIHILVANGYHHYPKESRLPKITIFKCDEPLWKAAWQILKEHPRKPSERYPDPEHYLGEFQIRVNIGSWDGVADALEKYFEECIKTDTEQWDIMKNHPLFQRATGVTIGFLKTFNIENLGPLTKSINAKAPEPFSERDRTTNPKPKYY
jgi:hypothetical protein